MFTGYSAIYKSDIIIIIIIVIIKYLMGDIMKHYCLRREEEKKKKKTPANILCVPSGKHPHSNHDDQMDVEYLHLTEIDAVYLEWLFAQVGPRWNRNLRLKISERGYTMCICLACYLLMSSNKWNTCILLSTSTIVYVYNIYIIYTFYLKLLPPYLWNNQIYVP